MTTFAWQTLNILCLKFTINNQHSLHIDAHPV